MEQIKETVLYTWKEVEEFYKRITPKHGNFTFALSQLEMVTKVETAIHISAHYLMMILTVILVLLAYVCLRRAFVTVVIIVPTMFVFFRDVYNKVNDKKWMYYWLFYTFLTIYSNVLSHIMYFDLIKIALCYFFAFFDKDNYLEKGFVYLQEGLKKAIEQYMSFCQDKSD